LYHPRWSPIVVHAAASTALWLAAVGLVVYGVAADPAIAIWAAAGLGTYWITQLVLTGILEATVAAVLRRRGESTHWWHWRTPIQLAAAIPLTQAVHFLATMEASFRRRVRWRGVTYDLNGPRNIRLVDEQPLEANVPLGESPMSL
jgi:hypothetical protein